MERLFLPPALFFSLERDQELAPDPGTLQFILACLPERLRLAYGKLQNAT